MEVDEPKDSVKGNSSIWKKLKQFVWIYLLLGRPLTVSVFIILQLFNFISIIDLIFMNLQHAALCFISVETIAILLIIVRYSKKKYHRYGFAVVIIGNFILTNITLLSSWGFMYDKSHFYICAIVAHLIDISVQLYIVSEFSKHNLAQIKNIEKTETITDPKEDGVSIVNEIKDHITAVDIDSSNPSEEQKDITNNGQVAKEDIELHEISEIKDSDIENIGQKHTENVELHQTSEIKHDNSENNSQKPKEGIKLQETSEIEYKDIENKDEIV